MKTFVKIAENLYSDHKHRYMIKECEFCGKDFYCRIVSNINGIQ